MSEVLRFVADRGRHAPPVLFVRCDFCRREYQTAQWPSRAREQVRCIACKRLRSYPARTPS